MAKGKSRKAPQSVELGGSGTTVYKGVITDVEYKPELSTEHNGNGLKIFNRMRKSDPIVRGSLWLLKLGLLQAEWTIEAGGDEDLDDEVRDFVEDALFKKMEKSWELTLEDFLTYLDFGFYVGEKIFKIEDNKVYLKKIAFRDQKSIVKFETEDSKEGVTQLLTGDAATKKGGKGITYISIPKEKIIVLSNQKEGDNWRGVSILRSAYKPWFMKENIEKIDAIGFERAAVGIPIFKMPANSKPEDKETAEELGEKLRANEKAYLVLPSGWEFEISSSKYDGQAADMAIGRYNRDIVSNVLAQFLDLGAGNTGSRALSEDQSAAFYKSLQAIADYIAGVINTEVIVQLVDANFNNVKNYPTLKATGIQKLDLEKFSAGLQRLALSQLLTPSIELEKHIRAQFKLPELLDDEIERIKKKDEQRQSPFEPDNNASGDTNNASNKDKSNSTDKKPKPGDKDIKDRTKTAHDHSQGKRHSEVDAISEFEYWRPFTFAEEKVNFRSLTRQMDNLERELSLDLQKTLAPEISGLMNDARQALQSRDAKRVEDLMIRFKAETRQKILDYLRKAFEAGKISAANEMDIKAPSTTNEMINSLTTRASAIADKMTQDLLNQAKLTTLDHIERGTAVDEALSSIETTLSGVIANATPLTSSVVTSGGINQGRYSVFEQYPERIHSLQRSEILDDRACNFCLSMDGRSVSTDDMIAKSGQFHFMCRGIWVEILKDEEELPMITGIPQQLRSRVGALTDFQQIDQAIPLPNSLADEFVKKQ